MKYSRTLRWGVIGLGWFGEVHAEVLSAMPGIELAAVCTRRPDRLKEMADRFDVPRRFTDYRELLADPEVTAALSPAEIEEKFDLGYHTKHVDTIFTRVFGQAS